MDRICDNCGRGFDIEEQGCQTRDGAFCSYICSLNHAEHHAPRCRCKRVLDVVEHWDTYGLPLCRECWQEEVAHALRFAWGGQ